MKIYLVGQPVREFKYFDSEIDINYIYADTGRITKQALNLIFADFWMCLIPNPPEKLYTNMSMINLLLATNFPVQDFVIFPAVISNSKNLFSLIFEDCLFGIIPDESYMSFSNQDFIFPLKDF